MQHISRGWRYGIPQPRYGEHEQGDRCNDPHQWSEKAAEEAAGEAVRTAGTDDPATTYREDDLIGAAEGVFGKGAKGVADMIKNLLSKQGEPNAYIVERLGRIRQIRCDGETRKD